MFKYKVDDILKDSAQATGDRYKVILSSKSHDEYYVEFIGSVKQPQWIDRQFVEDNTELVAAMKFKVGDTLRDTTDSSNGDYEVTRVMPSEKKYRLLWVRDNTEYTISQEAVESDLELVKPLDAVADKMRGQYTGGGVIPDLIYCSCTKPTIKQVLVGVVTADKYDFCTTCRKERQ